MARKAVTEEQKRDLKERYLADPYFKLSQVAKESKDICGVEVSHESLKIMSMLGGWGVEKRRQLLGKSGQPRDVSDEADDLRQIVYARLMDPDVDLDATSMSNLIRTWETIRAASPRKRSGKSDKQQVMDALRAGLENVRELENERSGS